MTGALVGREEERRRIARALADPAVRAVLLRGPAGAGKTALLEEVLDERRAAGALVGWGRYAAGESQSAFAPITAALSQAVSAALDQLYDPKAGVELLVDALGAGLPALMEAGFRLDGAPSPGAAERIAGRRLAALRVTEAALSVLRWLEGFGAPVLIFIDDWMRAPLEPRQFLRRLGEETGEGLVRLLAAERSGADEPRSAPPAGARVVHVGPLGAEERLALLSSELGDMAAGEAALAWLGPDCPELPLDLVETARALKDGGVLRRVRGRWSVDVARTAMLDRPDLARLTSRRLRALSPGARRTALAVCLWGEEADIEALASALDRPLADFRATLGELEGAGVLAVRSGQVKAPHDRVRAAILEDADQAETAAIAGAMAERLIDPALSDPRLLAAALHLRLTAGIAGSTPGVWRDAFALGAQQARTRADSAAAGRFADAAMALMEAEPGAPAGAVRRILAEALLAATDRGQAEAAANLSRRLIQAAGDDQDALGEAYELSIAACRLTGRTEAAWKISTEGLARVGVRLPGRIGAPHLLAAVLRWRSRRAVAGRRPLAVGGAPAGWTRVLNAAGTAAYERDPRLAALIGFAGVRRALKEPTLTPFWLAVDAFLCAVTGDLAEAARQAARVEPELERIGFGRAISAYRALFFGTIWTRPAAELRPLCRRVRDWALAEGDLVTAAVAVRNDVVLGWRASLSLPTFEAEAEAAAAEALRLGDAGVQGYVDLVLQMTRALIGGGPEPELRRLDGPVLEQLCAIDPGVAFEHLALRHDWEGVLALAERAAPWRSGQDSHPGGVAWRFVTSLARLRTGRAAAGADIAWLRRAARLNPRDHAAKLAILRAETLRRKGRKWPCLAAWDEAVEAGAGASPLVAGLAAECAADAARHFGELQAGERHLARALAVWEGWGAGSKLRAGAGASDGALATAEAQRAAAERAERAKSRFLAEVGHELRTPLQGMQGLLDLAAETPNAVDLAALGEVFSGLKSVVDDLTDYGALGGGETPPALEPVELRRLVESELRLASALMPDAVFQAEFAPGLPERVESDGPRVAQVVRNLLTNAAKYAGGCVLKVDAGPAADAGGLDVRIVAEDDGPGLRPGDLARIFEPFERAGGDQAAQGLGLGLALSRQIAARLGGSLKVENRPEGGARFVLSFPARALAAAAAARSAIPGLEVLLAEDTPLIRRVVAQLLEAQGHTVIQAADGHDAAAELDRRAFDLVMLDLGLPGVPGLELIGRIRAMDAAERPRIVVLTAASAEPALAAAREAGADLVLRKPVTAARLREAIAGLWDADPGEGGGPDPAAEARAMARSELLRLSAALGDGATPADAHRIAGLAAQFGWPDVARSAERLEQALARGDRDPRALAAALDETIRAALD